MTFEAIHAGSIMELGKKACIARKESKSVTKDPIVLGLTIDKEHHYENSPETYDLCRRYAYALFGGRQKLD